MFSLLYRKTILRSGHLEIYNGDERFSSVDARQNPAAGKARWFDVLAWLPSKAYIEWLLNVPFTISAQPAITTGNVGQLAVDLIIAKSGLASCGYLRAPQLLPCVGNNAYTDQDGICTELQLYHCLDSDLAVLQQRAPAALGRQVAFATLLAEFIQAAGIRKVVQLGSLAAGEPGSHGTLPHRLQYLCSDAAAFPPPGGCWEPLEAVDPLSNQIYTEQMLPPWPFWRACQHIGVPCLLLLCRANEGDNIQDAEYLAQAAVTYLMDVEGLSGQLPSLTKDSRWPAPPSWVVYGRQKAGLLL